MNMSVGIIGLPNAGKSTLFNALLKKQLALVAQYPFTTVEPNIGVVAVPDERLGIIAELIGSLWTVPATIEFVDIAGLIAGAHKGEGLGNRFLAHIREVDLICHVLRAFEDPNVVHVSGSVAPGSDKEIVETELILADLQTLEKQTEPKFNTDKNELHKWEVVKLLKQQLNQGKKAIEVMTDPASLAVIKDLHLLTCKPTIYIVNVAESDLSQSPKMQDAIVISAKIESELASLSNEEEREYLKQIGSAESGLEKLIKTAYRKLGLITFYSGNKKETHAWPIKSGSTAYEAAGVIHTDFQKFFISAAVISYDEFVKYKGFVSAGKLGKLQSVGKSYQIADGDIIDFKVGS